MTMTQANELAADIGKTGRVHDGDGLTFEVKIIDAKQSYGRLRYLVTPISGTGERWVENVTIDA